MLRCVFAKAACPRLGDKRSTTLVGIRYAGRDTGMQSKAEPRLRSLFEVARPRTFARNDSVWHPLVKSNHSTSGVTEQIRRYWQAGLRPCCR
jgi:hypothetical protein